MSIRSISLLLLFALTQAAGQSPDAARPPGPIFQGGELRGMYVFKAASLEEAQKLADGEPSVAAGAIVMKVYPWLGWMAGPER